MRRLLSLLAAAAVVLAVPAAVESAPRPAWHVGGPYGGTVSTLELDPARPSVVYAGTFGAGVFRSTDGGRTWRRRSAGLPPDTLVLALAAAPSSPSTLYLEAYAGQRLYRTVDGGRSWRALAPVNAGVSGMAVDPARSDTVYLATFEGVLRTSDGGASWVTLPGLQHPSKIAIAPSARNVLYAEDGGRIMRSGDGGASWSQRSISLEANYDVFAVDPRDPATLYVSTHDALLRSVDGGTRWTALRKGSFGLHVYVLAFDRSDPRRLYAGTWWRGVFRSTDAGGTWSHIGRLPRERVRDLAVRGGRVVAGLDHRGVYRLRGRRWAASSRGLVGAEVRALAVDPHSHVAYGGTVYGGVFRSVDGGRHWSARGLQGLIVNALAVDPAVSGVVYAGVGGGLYRTANGGRTWRRARGMPKIDVRAVAVAPSAHRVVYAGAFNGGTYVSRDGGSTWRRLALPVQEIVTALAVHPRRPTTVWAGTRAEGIVRSTDGGRTWKTSTGSAGPDVIAIVVTPSTPRILYAALDAGGVAKSTDGGRSWRRTVMGMKATTILGLALDRRHRATLYGGGLDPNGHGGVYRSTNAGRSWTDISAGMTTTWIAALALDPARRRLYAGTTAYGRESGGGVFVRRVP